MAENGAIEIPDRLLSKFNGDEVEPGPDQQQENKAVRDFTLDVAEKTMNVVYESMDELFKSKGGPGFGKVSTKDVSKLTVIYAKDKVPDSVLENSPGLALALILSGVVAQNGVAIKRNNKKQQKEETEKTGEDE